MYQMSYIMNLSIATLTFYGLSRLFPPEGLGVAEPWDAAFMVGQDANKPMETATKEEKEEHLSQIECLPNSVAV